jgi:glutamate/tyrosine decarboxylase-like PLP-dependent enzyme
LFLFRFRIREIESLTVLGDPRVCIVAFTSAKFSVYTLADKMKEKGWLLACLQFPTWYDSKLCNICAQSS